MRAMKILKQRRSAMTRRLYALIMILVLLWSSPARADYLGCFDASADVQIWAQFTNANGTAVSPTSLSAKVYSPTDTTAPTATPTLAEIDAGGSPGVTRGTFTLGSSPTAGAWQVQYKGTVGGVVLAATDTFLVPCPAAGGGGGTDWTSTELQQIRYRLGLDGATNVPSATPSLALQSSLDTKIPTNLSFTGANVNAQIKGLDNDIITAGKLASDVTTELQAGLLTSSAFDTKIPTAFTFTGSLVRTQVGALDSDVITSAAIQDGAIGAAEVGLPTGTVSAGAASCNGGVNSTTVFATSRTETVTNFWTSTQLITITSGALSGQTRQISGYTWTGAVGCFTVSSAFTGIPANGVSFLIVNK